MEIEISTERDRLDVALIHHWLSEHSYWARGRTMDAVRTSIDNSICFGAYADGRQVGFCRVVTDRATHAWLADVFVADKWRGRGCGKALVAAAMAHSELEGISRWILATRDAHGLYAQFGFIPVAPDLYMVRRANDT